MAMFRKLRGRSRMYLFVLLVMCAAVQVECANYKGKEENRDERSFVSKKIQEKDFTSLDEFSKALSNMLFTGRKKGGGGGGGGTGMFFMHTLFDMFNATVPMMAMTIMGWMKDIMMLGAGAFMMMMYDMLSKSGQEKKIIIKLTAPPPEPAPPAQTGYGPWEG